MPAKNKKKKGLIHALFMESPKTSKAPTDNRQGRKKMESYAASAARRGKAQTAPNTPGSIGRTHVDEDEMSEAALHKIADSKRKDRGIKISEKTENNLKKIPGGRIILRFLRWGPGGSIGMTLATMLDILSHPFAHMPGREVNWKKLLYAGILLIGVSIMIPMGVFYCMTHPIMSGYMTPTIMWAGTGISFALFTGSLAMLAGSYRLKTERNFRDFFSKKIDQSPAFDNGFMLKLGEVQLSLEDCHTNIGSFGGIGTGKLMWDKTPIPTANGDLEMGEITLGQMVKTPTGYAKVIRLFKDTRTAYELTDEKGNTALCCVEHLWKINRPEKKEEAITQTGSLIELLANGEKIQIPNVDPQTGETTWLDVTSITNTGAKLPMTCITIDDTEHLFVIKNGMVTHNCLHPDQKVLLFDGSIIAAKHVREGDWLMGPDGNPRIVKSTSTGYGPLYRIIPAGNKGDTTDGSSQGKSWICNDVHVMTLQYSNQGGSRPNRKSEKGINTNHHIDRKKSYKGLSFVFGNVVNHNKTKAKIIHERLERNNFIEDVDLNLILERSGQRDPSQFWKLFRPGKELEFMPSHLNNPAWTKKRISKIEALLKPEEFYLAGSWIGDGAKNAFGIFNENKEVLDSWRNYANSHPSILQQEKTVEGYSPEYRYLWLTPNSRGCATTPLQELILECIGNEEDPVEDKIAKKSFSSIYKAKPTWDKFIPLWVKTAPTKLRKELLAGLLDTDGHYSEENHCFDLVQKRKQIVEAACFIARSLGIACSEPVEETRSATNGTEGNAGQYWRICITGAIDKIPTRVHNKKVARKRATHRADGRNLPGVETRRQRDSLCHGWSAEPIGDGDYVGWTLDGDGRFLLDDFTVTHNTQAVMNPLLDQFFRQLSLPEPSEAQKLKEEFAWWHKNPLQKCGALILDQKGDFIDFVIYTMLRYGRPLEDLVVIDPTLDLYCYNPLDPVASADDNANMLSQIQKIASGGGGGGKDKFWDEASKDTVRDFLQLLEVIKPKEKIGLDDLARYIREDELAEYLCDKVEEVVHTKSAQGKITYEEKSKYLDTASRARAQWVENKSDNVKSTLKVTINQMLGDFAADPRLQKVFCRNTNFDFKDVFNKGKVVLFRGSGISEKTAKVICVALKLGFQTWAKRRNGANAEKYGINARRTCLFFVDEYQEFVTSDDGRFFGVSRSSKVAGVIATQAYSSLQYAMDNETATNLLRQNIGTWIFLRTTDQKTTELGESLSGQIEKEKLGRSIQADGIMDTAMNMAAGGHQSKGGDISVSKQFEAFIKKDAFLGLNTVDGNKSKTGPYYSEAIIYHYHDTDARRASRMYRTRLRHIYDIDVEYNNAFKSGKVSQNTMDLDQLMYDRNAEIRTLRRVLPAMQSVFKTTNVEREILEAQLIARNSKDKMVQEENDRDMRRSDLRNRILDRVMRDTDKNPETEDSETDDADNQFNELFTNLLERADQEELETENKELQEIIHEALQQNAPKEEIQLLQNTLADLREELDYRETVKADQEMKVFSQAIVHFQPQA